MATNLVLGALCWWKNWQLDFSPEIWFRYQLWYRPIWVSVSVSDLNHYSGFGRTLMYLPFIWFTLSSHSQKYQMTDFKWPLFTNSFHLVFEFFQFSSLKFGLMIFIPIIQKIKILFNFIWRARVSEWMSCKQFAIIIFAVKSLSLGKIKIYERYLKM